MSSSRRSTLAILAIAIACSSKRTRTTYAVVSPPRDGTRTPRPCRSTRAANGVIAEPPPSPDAIGVAQDGLLFRIDCGLSPDVNDSNGRLLRIRIDDAGLETEGYEDLMSA